MRAIKALFGLALGLALGAALGYGLLRWLLEHERQRSVLGVKGGLPAPKLVDQLQQRVRTAVEEGRRAAAEARAELEAEAYGASPRADEGREAVI